MHNYLIRIKSDIVQSKNNRNFEKLNKTILKVIKENIIHEDFDESKEQLLIFCMRNLKQFTDMKKFYVHDKVDQLKKEVKREETMVRSTSKMV